MTAAELLGLTQQPKGGLVGRVMSEALPNGTTPKAIDGTVNSKPAANGLRTVLKFQRVRAALFRRGGICRPHRRARGRGGKQKTAGK